VMPVRPAKEGGAPARPPRPPALTPTAITRPTPPTAYSQCNYWKHAFLRARVVADEPADHKCVIREVTRRWAGGLSILPILIFAPHWVGSDCRNSCYSDTPPHRLSDMSGPQQHGCRGPLSKTHVTAICRKTIAESDAQGAAFNMRSRGCAGYHDGLEPAPSPIEIVPSVEASENHQPLNFSQGRTLVRDFSSPRGCIRNTGPGAREMRAPLLRVCFQSNI
jgi:hypothetical protein